MCTMRSLGKKATSWVLSADHSVERRSTLACPVPGVEGSCPRGSDVLSWKGSGFEELQVFWEACASRSTVGSHDHGADDLQNNPHRWFPEKSKTPAGH